MDRFRTVLAILILLITIYLFYKLLERKHNMVEGLSSEFTTDMNAMRTLHSPDIQLPSYKVLKVAPRPANISSYATNTYNINKYRLTQKNMELNYTSFSLRRYNNLSASSRRRPR